MRIARPAVLLIAIGTISLSLAGCRIPSVTNRRADDSSRSAETTADGLPMPGLTKLSSTRTAAVGTLVWRSLEGGFFAVVDAQPGDVIAGDEPLVAVVLQPEGTSPADLEPLLGSYMQFTGVVSDGVNTRMAGTEIVAESYRILKRIP